jgi:DNA-binding CsgD family transcriptional regulator
MGANGDHLDHSASNVVRVLIESIGICIDFVTKGPVGTSPAMACVVVMGDDVQEMRISLGQPGRHVPDAAGEPRAPGARNVHAVPDIVARNLDGPLLSPREKEVLRHIVAGSSNKVIAKAMTITEDTVRGHVKSIFRKTGLENRTQAALWAVTLGGSA